jgi:hypothetical protein
VTHDEACELLVALGVRYKAREISGTEWAIEVQRIIAANIGKKQ